MHLVGRGDLVEKPWFSSAGERSRRAEVLDGAVQKWISAREVYAELGIAAPRLAELKEKGVI